MKAFSLALSLMLLGAFYTGLAQAQNAGRGQNPGQKPVRETVLHTDGGHTPPSTLGELAGLSDLIVLGDISELTPADSRYGAGDADPVMTIYTVTLAEVLKPSDKLPPGSTTVLVQRLGGTRERADHIEKRSVEGFANFEKGERYVLFLRYMVDGKFTPVAVKGNAAFRVNAAGRLIPSGNSDLSRSFAGKTAADLLTQLRRARAADDTPY